VFKININIAKYRKFIDYGNNLNSYHNRAFLGATALPLFTMFDCFNAPDKETRNNSLAKTWAKVIVGTATGVAVRFAGFRFAKRFASARADRIGEFGAILVDERKLGSLCFPKSRIKNYKASKEECADYILNYQKAFGTYSAVVAMLFTNFLIDMPLTILLTDFFRQKVFKQPQNKPNIFDTPQIQNTLRLALRGRLEAKK